MDCCKCGGHVNPKSDKAKDKYCDECQVRLGFIPRSEAPFPVRPDASDFYDKQMSEPILETYTYSFFKE